MPTASQVSDGIPIPAVRLLQVMSSDEWEGFTEEWLSFHKANGTYQSTPASLAVAQYAHLGRSVAAGRTARHCQVEASVVSLKLCK